MGDPTEGGRFVFVVPEEERYGPGRGGAIATCIREMSREMLATGSTVRVISPRSGEAPYREGMVTTLARSGDPRSTFERVIRSALGRVLPRHWGPRARYVAGVRNAVHSGERVVVSNDPELAALLAGDGTEVVLWVHNYLSGAARDALGRLPRSVAIAAVSDSVREWTEQSVGPDASRPVTVYNGVNRATFPPAVRTSDAVAPVRVIIPGRIDPNKGQLLAINAVAEAYRRGMRSVEVSVMGGVQTFGHAYEAVATYQDELLRAGREVGAVFLGRVDTDHVGSILRSHDIALVLPLVPEPFGLAALEAMASGCAVIAVPTGGSTEVLGDGAMLVGPDVGEVASALQRLVEDPELRQRLSKRAIDTSMRFSWAESAAALLDITGRGRRAATG
ncbi:glycosyltransferase family 4 protein [Microbacterium sp. ARD31]|uniref:glycosyltransferase family 4 protein n=1 Tax=Microbacterium sp. ARD31 TaxID=2962576 RepID=UPI002880DE93|nr:glycosyltransferase family 4 protein [Microbacterium sp. ARD31]MDT0186472.1 glycosyltransferase family 4 protein [Microbacterium sp. ARD31]